MTFDLAQMIADREAGTPEFGGWAWFGGRDHIYLATNKGGRRFIMDFVRKGLQSAQPRFQIGSIMYPAIDHLTQYEVGDGTARGQRAADADKSVYRLDISGIDHPDARRIARVPAMEAEIIRLTARVEALEDALTRYVAQEVGYMTINNLGDPNKQHMVIRARAALSTPTEEPK